MVAAAAAAADPKPDPDPEPEPDPEPDADAEAKAADLGTAASGTEEVCRCEARDGRERRHVLGNGKGASGATAEASTWVDIRTLAGTATPHCGDRGEQRETDVRAGVVVVVVKVMVVAGGWTLVLVG